MPANHGLGANDMERVSPPRPLVGEPQPEETVEAPELRSLRPAAKQNELLPQRQVLEREVRAGSERRTQRAQQSDYEGHCLPGSHAAESSSRVLANDRSSGPTLSSSRDADDWPIARSLLHPGFWQTTSVRVLSDARSAPNKASTRDIASLAGTSLGH